jgi:hypothetical protein
MKSQSVILDLRLSEEALINMQLEAAGLGVTNGQAASAILEHGFAKGAFMDDARVLLIVDKVRSLCSELRPDLEAIAIDYRKALATAEAEVQARLEESRSDRLTIELAPAMVTFMREIERLFPELWDIFAGECVEAVLDGMEHYIDNAYSFPSSQDRMEAFRQVREARDAYQRADNSQRGAST